MSDQYAPTPAVVQVRQWLLSVIESKERTLVTAKGHAYESALRQVEWELACARRALRLLEDK